MNQQTKENSTIDNNNSNYSEQQLLQSFQKQFIIQCDLLNDLAKKLKHPNLLTPKIPQQDPVETLQLLIKNNFFIQELTPLTYIMQEFQENDEQIKKLQSQISHLEADNFSLNANIQSLQNSNNVQCNLLQDEIGQLQKKINDQKQQEIQKNAALSQNKFIMEYRKQIDEKTLIVNSLAAEKDKINLVYKKAVNDNEKLKVIIEEKEVEIEGLIQQNQEKQLQIEKQGEQQKQFAQLEKNEKQLTQKLKSLENEKQQLIVHLKKLQDQIEQTGNITLKDIQELRLQIHEGQMIINSNELTIEKQNLQLCNLRNIIQVQENKLQEKQRFINIQQQNSLKLKELVELKMKEIINFEFVEQGNVSPKKSIIFKKKSTQN